MVFFRSVRRLLVTARVVPISPFLVTLMKEALSSSETAVLTRATRRNIPNAILHSHRHENLKSYILVFPRNVLQLLVTANVVPNSLILFTLMMKAILSCEMSVLTTVTRRHIQEDGILHSHRLENLNSYVLPVFFKLSYGVRSKALEYFRTKQ
jgi:hypothetical protein